MKAQVNGSHLPKAKFIRHENCPDCGSSDARSYYDDGHYYCFACEKHTPAESGGASNENSTSQVSHQPKAIEKDLLKGTFETLKLED